MTDPTRSEATRPSSPYKAPLLLAGGGAAAGFCAASCCGLPVLLGAAGMGSGWFVALAWLAAPYRVALLVAAAILLAAGAGAFLWRRRVAYCAVRSSSAGAAAGALLVTFVLLGSALVLLGYVYG